MEIFIDSQTLADSVYSTKPIEEKTTRHLIAWVKQMLEEKKIEIFFKISSKENLADVFTKKGVDSVSILETIREGRIQNYHH